MTVTSFAGQKDHSSALIRSLFQQEMIDGGILFDDGFVTCAAHSDSDVGATLKVVRSGLAVLRDALAEGNVRERIRGIPIQPLFV